MGVWMGDGVAPARTGEGEAGRVGVRGSVEVACKGRAVAVLPVSVVIVEGAGVSSGWACVTWGVAVAAAGVCVESTGDVGLAREAPLGRVVETAGVEVDPWSQAESTVRSTSSAIRLAARTPAFRGERGFVSERVGHVSRGRICSARSRRRGKKERRR